MSVAFPSQYYLTKESSVEVSTNETHDVMDDGALRSRILGSTIYESIRCVLPYLSQADYLSFKTFVTSNRGTDITMTLDGASYTGRITSGLSVQKRGGWFRVSFVYYASAA